MLLKRSVIIKLCNAFLANTLSSYCSLSRCKRQILPHSKNFDTTMLQTSSNKCLEIIRVVIEKYRIPHTSKVPNYPDIGYRIYPDWTRYGASTTFEVGLTRGHALGREGVKPACTGQKAYFVILIYRLIILLREHSHE